MNPRDPDPASTPGADAAAAAWVVRHERGLTAAEQDAFSAWLAEDPRHRMAFAEQHWSWEEMDRLNGLQTSVHAVPEETRPAARRFAAPLAVAGIALAAAIIYLGLNRPPATAPTLATSPLALCEEEELADGSRVVLNRGTAISVQFTARDRRVRLVHGEAHFAVAKDPARPFVVEVDGVAVRAVGTAFSVKRGVDSVAVLVTEGIVSVKSPAVADTARAPLVTAGQKAVVSLSPQAAATVIEDVAVAEMEARLAWKPRLLEFDEASLAEIAAEFNRRNAVRIDIVDSALHDRRLSATLRSDNVEGFVRMLEADFGIRASRPRAGVIALQRKP